MMNTAPDFPAPNTSKSLAPPAESRSGESFKNGKLYDFGKKRILVAKSWPEMRAWYKTAKLPWRPTRKFADECIMDSLFPRVMPPLTEEQQINEKYHREMDEKNHLAWLESLDDQGRLEYDQKMLEWERIDTIWDPIYKKLAERRHLVLTQFFDAIPDPEREFVLRFHKRRWHLLALFARCPGAFELAQSNPALAYALANNWVFHQPAVSQPMRAARALVKKKQRSILAWLGFPETEQARKILAKIQPEEISLVGLLNLRQFLACPTSLKLLSHASMISSSMLIFMSKAEIRPWLTPIFIEEISSYRVGLNFGEYPPIEKGPKQFSEIYNYLCDFLRMQEQIQGALLPLRSIAQLKEMHDEAIKVYNAMDKTVSLLPFPPPPFPGKKEFIEPLTCEQLLLDEGLEMAHCVGSYAGVVRRGEVYVYKVFSPVRATLSIRRHAHGWQFDDIRGASNQKIPTHIEKKLCEELLHGYE